MASINPGTIIKTVLNVVADITLDAAELEAGTDVTVGQIGSIEGKPVYIKLSTTP